MVSLLVFDDGTSHLMDCHTSMDAELLLSKRVDYCIRAASYPMDTELMIPVDVAPRTFVDAEVLRPKDTVKLKLMVEQSH